MFCLLVSVKIKCLICGKEVTNNNSYIGSHVKRIHNLSLVDYIKKARSVNQTDDQTRNLLYKNGLFSCFTGLH